MLVQMEENSTMMGVMAGILGENFDLKKVEFCFETFKLISKGQEGARVNDPKIREKIKDRKVDPKSIPVKTLMLYRFELTDWIDRNC